MAELVHFPTRHQPGRLLTKKQLATELGRSTRWINLRMEEGMPVEPRQSDREHARFDLTKVRRWLETRAQTKPMSLEERVALLERTVAALSERKAS